MVEVHADRAQSGASRFRLGYQRLLADVRASGVDVVLAEALDRLSRDQEDVAALFKQLAFAGVGPGHPGRGGIKDLHVSLTGTMNALCLTPRRPTAAPACCATTFCRCTPRSTCRWPRP